MNHETLTKQLRQLEEFGIVHREVYHQVPPKVEYSLTELGHKLEPTLACLSEWGQEYIKERGKVIVFCKLHFCSRSIGKWI